MRNKVLIVDDTIANIDLLVTLLASQNYEISVATSGQQALFLVQRDPPDLILLDVVMPGMSGYEVCKQLAEKPLTSSIAVIFVTAKNDTEDIVKGFQLGAVDYLIKPVQRQEVLVRVATHLQIQGLLKSERQRCYELQKQTDTAVKATALKDKFVSLVAHDLRSPFNGLLGYVGLLLERDDPLTEFQRTILTKILKSGEKQIEMIDELLNISRLQTGKISPDFKFFELYAVVQEAIEKNIYFSDIKAIKIENQVSKKNRVYADRNLLIEVIHNLISNAIKFSYNKSKIEIKVQINEKIILSVVDFGKGITDEHLDKLFKLEEKTTTKGTSGETGTGFGLPYSHHIIAAHHGQITVQSTLGEGSCFSVHLPKIMPNILVVEDDKATGQLLLEMIRVQPDYHTILVNDGEEALETLEKLNIHLLLSDLRMPNLDGLGLLERMKKTPAFKEIPFIMFTGDEDEEKRIRCLDMGAIDYVNKPIKASDLLPRIIRILK